MSRLDRKEFKFVIPISQRDEIIECLQDKIGVDENAGANAGYPIVSQYYDTTDRACYWEKAEGLKHRRKLRVRVYGDENGEIPPTVFVEVKAKSFQRGVKRRLNVPLQTAVELALGETRGYEELKRPECRNERLIVNEITDLVHRRKFAPSVAIRYDRLAFQGSIGRDDLRITFDSNLLCRFRDEELKPNCRDFDHELLDRDLCIMELKTIDSVPMWVCKLLSDLKLRPRGFSKYCTSIERFDPGFASVALAG